MPLARNTQPTTIVIPRVATGGTMIAIVPSASRMITVPFVRSGFDDLILMPPPSN
jgi:hypothetical protein